MSLIEVSSKDEITTLTLNRDNKRNAFSNEMSEAVISAIDTAQKNGQRIVVIRANPGAKIWSAGHDLTELTSVEDVAHDPMFEMFDKVVHCSMPVIALVEGDVYAGALQLLINCDIVIASDKSTVTMTANKMGVPFALKNYAQWLSVLGLHKVKELFYTASYINADDAHNVGLFNHIVSVSDLDAKLDGICQSILRCSPEGIANSKLQLNALAEAVDLPYDTTELIEKDRHRILTGESLATRINDLIQSLHHKK